MRNFLRTCGEEDLLRIPNEILDELTPEQICLTPTIVCAYTVLEQFGSKLKPGDSVLLNAAHLSASGSALLQLCKLLKLKPLCMLSLPGSPKNLAKGEYGSKSAWADVDSRAAAPPTVRQQYERISELLVTMGAEEVFPDAVALLRWRDRNQRMLPKLALDGIATRDSCEQLIHCLQSGLFFCRKTWFLKILFDLVWKWNTLRFEMILTYGEIAKLFSCQETRMLRLWSMAMVLLSPWRSPHLFWLLGVGESLASTLPGGFIPCLEMPRRWWQWWRMHLGQHIFHWNNMKLPINALENLKGDSIITSMVIIIISLIIKSVHIKPKKYFRNLENMFFHLVFDSAFNFGPGHKVGSRQQVCARHGDVQGRRRRHQRCVLSSRWRSRQHPGAWKNSVSVSMLSAGSNPTWKFGRNFWKHCFGGPHVFFFFSVRWACQVVLIFPTLQEELTLSHQEQKAEMEKQARLKAGRKKSLRCCCKRGSRSTLLFHVVSLVNLVLPGLLFFIFLLFLHFAHFLTGRRGSKKEGGGWAWQAEVWLAATRLQCGAVSVGLVFFLWCKFSSYVWNAFTFDVFRWHQESALHRPVGGCDEPRGGSVKKTSKRKVTASCARVPCLLRTRVAQQKRVASIFCILLMSTSDGIHKGSISKLAKRHSAAEVEILQIPPPCWCGSETIQSLMLQPCGTAAV